MTRREAGIELPEDVTEDDLQDIESFLSRHEVKYPGEAEIERTVEELRLHMLLSGRRARGGQRAAKLLRLAAMEVSFFHPYYWIASLLLYIAGYIAVTSGMGASPPAILFILAPVPFVLGAAEVFRSRDERMLELEMSCVYNAASVMLAKLCIVGCYSVCLNFAFSLAISGVSSHALSELTLLWLAPFTIVSGLSLTAAVRMRGSAAVMLVLLVWGAVCMLLLLKPSWSYSLLAVHPFFYAPLVLAGGLLTVMQVWNLVRAIDNKREGMYPGEVDH